MITKSISTQVIHRPIDHGSKGTNLSDDELYVTIIAAQRLRPGRKYGYSP
jgi:hypothetical protein